ncbi:MAG: hypothetical protein QW332_06175 [Thermoproteota archaeon]
MSGKNVCIRVNEDDWIEFKNIAESLGMSRNEIINLFISSIVRGYTKIQQQSNIMNININLVPISNNTLNVAYHMTREMKNSLIIDEIAKHVEQAEKMAESGRQIPYVIKDKVRKLVNKATLIPPELFERARRVILT